MNKKTNDYYYNKLLFLFPYALFGVSVRHKTEINSQILKKSSFIFPI